MTKLIGLSGPMGVGKSTVAQFIWVELAKRRVAGMTMSFATPLKRMIAELLHAAGMPEGEAVDYIMLRGRREEPCDYLGGRSVRHAMQTLGTEWGRECIGDTFWADIGIRKALSSNSDVVIFDDVRFKNEIEVIRSEGGVIFELLRDGVAYPQGHKSEGGIAGLGIQVDNNRPPEVVAQEILEILQ